jgi:hypothetical protein
MKVLQKQDLLGAGTFGPAITGREIWDGPDLYVRESLASGDITRFTRGQKSAAFRPPTSSRFADVLDGQGYFWSKETTGASGETKVIRFLRTSDFHAYEPMGTFEAAHALLDFKMLGDGRLLLLFGLVPLAVGDGTSFLVIARPTDSGVWELDQALDLGLDLFDPVKQRQFPQMPLVWGRDEKQLYLHDLVEAKLHRLGSYLVLPLQATGTVLMFKAENGSPLGKALLYPSVETELQRRRPIERSILGYRPTPDGDLILATRTEDAVLNARGIFQDGVSFRGMDAETRARRLKEVQSEALVAFPDLLWWRFSPGTRDFLPISHPIGLPSSLRTFDELKGFQFWVDSKGNPVSSLSSLLGPEGRRN